MNSENRAKETPQQRFNRLRQAGLVDKATLARVSGLARRTIKVALDGQRVRVSTTQKISKALARIEKQAA